MKIPHNRITYSETEVNSVANVVRSGQWAIGAKTRQMEGMLCRIFRSSQAIGVGSGIAALRLSLLGLGVNSGDEVIIPAYSCVALANAVLSIGARPIAADVMPHTWNLDPHDVKERITKDTKAIIAVNTFGMPAPIGELSSTGVKVVEDASHGFACSETDGVLELKADVKIFSFFATKLIAGGEGGAILTDDEKVASVVRDYRDYTDKMPDGNRLNDKLTDLESALVVSQLEKIQDMIAERSRIAKRYREILKGINQITLPATSDERVWYRYALEVPADSIYYISNFLARRGVSVNRPIEWWLETSEGFKMARHAHETLLSIPLFPSLSPMEQEYVCNLIIEACVR